MEVNYNDLIKMTEVVAKESAEKAVASTLERLGISSGFISQNKAMKLYGQVVVEAIKAGKIQPCHVGTGKNGKKTYSTQEISNYITGLRHAEVIIR